MPKISPIVPLTIPAPPGRVVVAGDIETAQRRAQTEQDGSEVKSVESASQMRVTSLQSVPPVKAMRAPAGARNSVSARRRAARNLRLSIIEVVSARSLSRSGQHIREARLHAP